ncbi:MAG: hypothetical protein ABIJ09_17705 [Pseudomonadota bacterium]
MTRMSVVLLLSTVLACATTPNAGDSANRHADARARGVTSTDATVVTKPRSPLQPVDVCAQFEREQQSALSPDEHMRTFGCPPCPCGCVNGQITCAPCAACESFGEQPRLDPVPGVAEE